MGDFFKYDVQCGDVLAECGETTATAGEKHEVVILPLCGEDFAQCGEPEALAGNYENAFNNTALAVTENLDTLAALIENSVNANFTITEAVDSAALQSTVDISASMAAIEPVDVTAISVDTSREAALAVTENRDGVNIRVVHQAAPAQRQISVPYSRYVAPEISAALAVSEATDRCHIIAETVPAAVSLSVSEPTDGINITAEYIENFYNEKENLILILALINRRAA